MLITGLPHIQLAESNSAFRIVKFLAKVIDCGIPQGSCLDSLLFILYVNDFEQCLYESSPTIYAEDTTVTYAASVLLELHQVITTDLSNVSEWMRVNKLSLNVNKGKFIVIGNTKQI